jgi:predicted nicotinamide N-methyase
LFAARICSNPSAMAETASEKSASIAAASEAVDVPPEEYVYDITPELRLGLVMRELVPEMHTQGPTKCYRERATDDYTGWTIWASSVLSARWLLEHAELLRGKDVIELGAGCGLTGLAAAAGSSARTVVLNDYPRETMENLLHNTARNCRRLRRRDECRPGGEDDDAALRGRVAHLAPPRGIGGGPPMELSAVVGGERCAGTDAFVGAGGAVVTIAQMDWDDDATWPRSLGAGPDNGRVGGGDGGFATYDVVLAADLCYRRSYARKVAAAAARLLRSGGKLIVFTPTAREGLPVLDRMMAAAGFTAEEHELPWEWRVNPLRRPDDAVGAPPALPGGPPVRLVDDDAARSMFPELFVGTYAIVVIVFTRPETTTTAAGGEPESGEEPEVAACS